RGGGDRPQFLARAAEEESPQLPDRHQQHQNQEHDHGDDDDVLDDGERAEETLSEGRVLGHPYHRIKSFGCVPIFFSNSAGTKSLMSVMVSLPRLSITFQILSWMPFSFASRRLLVITQVPNRRRPMMLWTFTPFTIMRWKSCILKSPCLRPKRTT